MVSRTVTRGACAVSAVRPAIGDTGAAGPDPAARPLADLVGAGLRVPVTGGGELPFANLDIAATAPCLVAVRDAVDEILPWYASVHRGAGRPAQICTAAYERARTTVLGFAGPGPGHTVVFTRNTTDALSLLARCLPGGTTVIGFDTDHHSALLAWRRGRVQRLRTPASPAAAVAAMDRALAAAPVGPRLICVTGASNVTGEVWPLADLADVAHRHGARIAVDAAQLAPHRPIDMGRLELDYVALSGHKLYAPFGSGALIGRSDWMAAAPPYLAGGGAAGHVADDGTAAWADGPARHEGGTPNLIGAAALAAACDAITAIGWAAVREHEQRLQRALLDGLAEVDGLSVLRLWEDAVPRVGITSFTVAGVEPGWIAQVLAERHGIGVRHGKFCAHPLVRRLTGGGDAVRISFGLGTTAGHIRRVTGALAALGGRSRRDAQPFIVRKG
ncbi:MAG TPA: aminotransferase class V-fold PLP-dependent enzyme [Streptosporangiaceae bacterium]|jgi:selenocysteine lyase/cysteine desulfurase|nr:aminotransferase class V-fold PLP-dependent enzyme [Streptosporangiaceae bacterium]